MVRTYVRKTNRQAWDDEAMENAIRAVVKKEMSYYCASESFNVPRSALANRVKIFLKTWDMELATLKGLGSFQTVFSPVQEQELVKYLQEMDDHLQGLTRFELRVLAYQLAEKNNIPNKFVGGLASTDWVCGFLKRHRELGLRKPEATSAARARGFNKIVVQNFFDLLESVYTKYCFTPDRIYNVDEAGFSSVPKHQSKIISTRGKRQVGIITSAERGKNTTVEMCISASGKYLPPLFVFPRVRINPAFMIGAPQGSWSACHPSGWMQSDIFLKWLKWFTKLTKPTEDNPILLLLDGHTTHTKNLEVIDWARKSHIIIICFPPHCTHRLQPLDVSVMRPLSIAYSAAVKMWMQEHPSQVVTPAEIPMLIGEAMKTAATTNSAVNGFRTTGIWPFNRNAFDDVTFTSFGVLDESTSLIERASSPLESSTIPFDETSSDLPRITIWPSDHEVLTTPRPNYESSHDPHMPSTSHYKEPSSYYQKVSQSNYQESSPNVDRQSPGNLALDLNHTPLFSPSRIWSQKSHEDSPTTYETHANIFRKLSPNPPCETSQKFSQQKSERPPHKSKIRSFFESVMNHFVKSKPLTPPQSLSSFETFTTKLNERFSQISMENYEDSADVKNLSEGVGEKLMETDFSEKPAVWDEITFSDIESSQSSHQNFSSHQCEDALKNTLAEKLQEETESNTIVLGLEDSNTFLDERFTFPKSGSCDIRNLSPVAHCSSANPPDYVVKRPRRSITRPVTENDSSDGENFDGGSGQSVFQEPKNKRRKPTIVSPTQRIRTRQSRNNNHFGVSPFALQSVPMTAPRARRGNRGRTAIITSPSYRATLASRKKKTPNTAKPTSSEDVACIFCNDLYSNSSEDWISCTLCYKWTHCLCAGVDEDDVIYQCDFCRK